jgi:ATP-dependent DNA helicase RecQ
MRGNAPARMILPEEPRRRRGAGGASASGGAGAGAKTKVEIEALGTDERELFERLRARRAELARAKGLPAYVICHDKTLVALAHRKPTTRGELLEVHGMGPARVDMYGDALLEVLGGH